MSTVSFRARGYIARAGEMAERAMLEVWTMAARGKHVELTVRYENGMVFAPLSPSDARILAAALVEYADAVGPVVAQPEQANDTDPFKDEDER